MRPHLSSTRFGVLPVDGERTFYCAVCRCRVTVDVDGVAAVDADEFGHAGNCPHRPAALEWGNPRAPSRMALPDGGGPDA